MLKEEIQFSQNRFHPFIKGINLAAFILCLLALFIGGFFFRTGISAWLQTVAYLLTGVIVYGLFKYLGAWITGWLKKTPTIYYSIGFGLFATLFLASQMRFNWPGAVYPQSVFLGLGSLSLLFLVGFLVP